MRLIRELGASSDNQGTNTNTVMLCAGKLATKALVAGSVMSGAAAGPETAAPTPLVPVIR